MAELFKAKVRHVGSSLGILIPMGIIKKESIREGNEIEIAILKKDVKLLEEAFGSVKNPKFKFKRDTRNRI